MTKTTEFPIEFQEESNYSSEPGERAFYSTNIDPWRIFISYENHRVDGISIQNGKSWIHLGADNKLVISESTYEREVVTTAEDAIEAHWAKKALRTIWKAVR